MKAEHILLLVDDPEACRALSVYEDVAVGWKNPVPDYNDLVYWERMSGVSQMRLQNLFAMFDATEMINTHGRTMDETARRYLRNRAFVAAGIPLPKRTSE